MKILSIVLQSLGGVSIIMQIINFFYQMPNSDYSEIARRLTTTDSFLLNYSVLIGYNAPFTLGVFLLIAGNRLQKKYIEKKVRENIGNS